MSRKAVLNVTSTKKRDTMVAGNTFPALPTNVGALTVTSDAPAVVMWNATARMAGATPTIGLTMPINAQRLSQTPFIRGLKETITVRTGSSNAWRWRRIVFFMKGLPPGVDDAADPNLARYFTQIDDGTGYLEFQRVNTALPFAMVSEIYRFIFKGFGVNNVSATPRDWMDPITAPIDTSRIKVAYDKVTPITSGNDTGIVRTHRRWHGVNRTLHYDDIETGGRITSGPFSTAAKMGCGDMYVVDIIVGNSSDETDILDFLPTTTLYWHEK